MLVDSPSSFSNQRQLVDASLQGTVDRVPGVRASALDIEGYAQLVGRDGKPLGHPVNGPPTLGEAWAAEPSLNPLRLTTGRPPATPDARNHARDARARTDGTPSDPENAR